LIISHVGSGLFLLRLQTLPLSRGPLEVRRGAPRLRTWGVCLAVMTDPFAPQVLSIKADDKISNAVTAGL